MNRATRIGLSVLAVALLLGLLGDVLLRVGPWGLNIALWVMALLAATLGVANWRDVALRGGGRWFVIPALFFAAAFAWRDSSALRTWNEAALLASLVVIAWRARLGRVLIASVREYVIGIIAAGVNALFGVFTMMTQNIRWKSLPRNRWSTRTLAVVRGLIIVTPLLLIFGLLFVAADAIFEDFVADLFNWDIDLLIDHTLHIILWAVLGGGFLYQVLLGTDEVASLKARKGSSAMGVIEIGTALTALNVLFLAFMIVQLGYLFGGVEYIERVAGLTYSEYARRGFFELVAVAALVLPLLLFANFLLGETNAMGRRMFQLLVAMMFVIMVSAVQRMLLYQREFGLTELRLYTTAFMVWLSVVFAWFVASVLRGRSNQFAFGALMAYFAVTALLFVINPDDLIVRVNTTRGEASRAFDAAYVSRLSADAVPALVEALPQMNKEDRCTVSKRLVTQSSNLFNPEWHTLNLSRVQASSAIRSQQRLIDGACQNLEP